jgi:hypothetical protein
MHEGNRIDAWIKLMPEKNAFIMIANSTTHPVSVIHWLISGPIFPPPCVESNGNLTQL